MAKTALHRWSAVKIIRIIRILSRFFAVEKANDKIRKAARKLLQMFDDITSLIAYLRCWTPRHVDTTR